MMQGKSSHPSLASIDWELCIKLANHKEDVAKEVLDIVVQQLPADLKIIQEAYLKQDFTELLRYVHKVHGALCYTGLPALKAVILGLESCLKKSKEDSEGLKALLQELDVEVQRVLATESPH